MNKDLQELLNFIEQTSSIKEEEKNSLKKSISELKKEIELTQFKLQRSEKVKNTTSRLLEETIEELEKKRKTVEDKNRELEIETALERVRAKTMAMHNSQDVTETVITLFDELIFLGIETIRCGIAIQNDSGIVEIWTIASDKPKSELIIGKLNMHIHPMLEGGWLAWKNGQDYYSYELAGNDLLSYFQAVNNYENYPVNYDIHSMPSRMVHCEFYFPEGLIYSNSNGELPSETVKIFKRFAGVFGQTYRRYLDLQKAEYQARESQIEAALAKVRGKAMAMNNSQDLSMTASMVFTELRKLGIHPIRSGVGIIDKETKKIQLFSNASNQEGDSFSLMGEGFMTGHPVSEKSYQAWLRQENFFFSLKGNEIKAYNDFISSSYKQPVLSNNEENELFGHWLVFSEGLLFAWSDKPYSESEINILDRFKKIIELTFRRYNDLQKSEANTREAIKQAALDRVRADIASMRTAQDLERITPLIWNELTVLGIPFIRCGVFIMDEEEKQIHTFLSTPEGNSIAAFHLPYDAPGNFAEIIEHWHQKKNYMDHWSGSDFKSLAENLVKQGAIQSSDQYTSNLPGEGIYLHFLPFLQGMLYVGNIHRLNDEQVGLIQSLADAFSTAYARYEDFNLLETAKLQVEKTLVDLKQTQQQLVQAEKMASLGALTAGIAHEIQNPLNFVNNFSEVCTELIGELNIERSKLLKERDLELENEIILELRQNLEKIIHHGKRADGIVKGMLQHSQVSSGQRELTDINALTDEYIRLCYHGLRAKDKSFNSLIQTDFDPRIDKVNIVGQDIGRVLLNLLTNAFYAVNKTKSERNEDYSPRVQVTTKKSGETLIIKVEDNGEGIPAEIIDKIFQPFFTTKPTGQGTGLGLSLSYDIIKAHGGELKVNSREGEGSVFTIILPV